MRIEIVGGRRWYRLSKPSSEYAVSGKVTNLVALAYEAVKAVGEELALAGVTHVIVVAPPRSAINKSNAFTQSRGRGIPVPGGEARFGAMLGSNTYARIQQGSYSAHHMTHELMHNFGLPDLYDVSKADIVQNAQVAGGWDPMGWVISLRNPLTWHKRRLGWLADDQLTCLDAHSTRGETAEVTVTPNDVKDGTKAVGIVLDSSRVLLAEVRRRAGADADIADEGVLIYEVDVRRGTGTLPVTVFAAHPDSAGPSPRNTGPLPFATFGIGNGRRSRFEHSSSAVVEVVGRTGDAYRIRVTR
jgi:M6 family metalloprotease-like protein